MSQEIARLVEDFNNQEFILTRKEDGELVFLSRTGEEMSPIGHAIWKNLNMKLQPWQEEIMQRVTQPAAAERM